MKREGLRAFGLALAVAALWCFSYGRTSLSAWRVPVDYYGDAWPTLTLLKAAAEGHYVPLRLDVEIPQLGAPFGAGRNRYLHQHKLQYWLAGRLVPAIGLFPAANLLLPLAAVLAALSFYAVCRYFRARPEWALVGAVAFALSPYLFYRSLSHLTLSFYWPLPLAILATTWAFGRHGLVVRSRRFAAAAAIVFVTGLHNVYYPGLLAQFLVLAVIARVLRTRRPAAALPQLLLLVILVAAVALDSANVLLAAVQGGTSDAIARPFGNLERYALKPIELLLPPLARPGLAPWAPLGEVYFRGALYRGEMGSAYLGLAGVAALVALCVAASASYLRRPRGFVPAAFLAVAWILAESVVGGLNAVLGTLGFVFFRATGRYSIWILALVLLWAVVRVSRTSLARWRGASFVALAVGALALVDQLPARTSPTEIARTAATVASDAALARSLEAALPGGAMLFQLPVVDFPEGPAVQRATDYEHLRPYLQSTRLRFSYGADKGGRREAWQQRAAVLEPEALAIALERIGFAGLLINRKGYEDGARALRERLAASGRPEAWESPDHDFLFVRLNPSASPEPPDQAIPEMGPAGAGEP